MKSRQALPLNIVRRSYSSSHDSKAFLRQAQSIELFRSQFYRTSNSDVTISVNDIDDLIKHSQVRPSLLITPFECLGATIGTVYRFSPTPIKTYIANGVNLAVSNQFNNNIRELQDDDQDEEYTPNTITTSSASDFSNEVKETLKYHRDVSVDSNHANTHDTSSTASSILSSTTNAVGLGLNSLFTLSKLL